MESRYGPPRRADLLVLAANEALKRGLTPLRQNQRRGIRFDDSSSGSEQITSRWREREHDLH